MSLKASELVDCTICMHYKENTCTCDSSDIKDNFRVYGKTVAKRCAEFRNERIPMSGEISLENALVFMLAGCSEFTMVSGNTGKKLYYRLDKKISSSNSDEFVYWLNVGEQNGTFTYAGVLFFDNNDKRFKFGRGARGKLNPSDIRVRSILFVLNNLNNNKTNMPLKIYHVGKCGRCGKRLTDPSSILTGLGATCARECGVPMQKIK
jgi:hypothetical protein